MVRASGATASDYRVKSPSLVLPLLVAARVPSVETESADWKIVDRVGTTARQMLSAVTVSALTASALFRVRLKVSFAGIWPGQRLPVVMG
jgi:hypothetical protein